MRLLYYVTALLALSSSSLGVESLSTRARLQQLQENIAQAAAPTAPITAGTLTLDGLVSNDVIVKFNHGVAMPLTSGPSNTSRASGRSVHQDVTITRNTDDKTSSFALKCNGGEDIKSGSITGVLNPVADCVPTWAFDSLILTSVSTYFDKDAGVYKDDITFNYKKVTWACNKGSATGTPLNKHSWSLENNKGT